MADSLPQPEEKQPNKREGIPSPDPSSQHPKKEPTQEGEVVSNIDDYQKKLESQWEMAKSSYQDKIDQILDEFIDQNLSDFNTDQFNIHIEDSSKKSKFKESLSKEDRINQRKNPDEKMDKLFSRAERALRKADRASKYFDTSTSTRPPVINISLSPYISWTRKIMTSLLVLALLGAGGYGVFAWRQIGTTTELPYRHVGGVVTYHNDFYIVDWFRKSLYVHARKRGLPIISVENLPNEYVTGITFSENKLWTLDAFNLKLLRHGLIPEHPVEEEIPLPGTQPVGLFYDGMNLWSMDSSLKKLFKHHEIHPEEIREQYTLPNGNVTTFSMFQKRVWVLDQKSRQITIYRLQEPLRLITTFDLDPFMEGATPTGLVVEEKQIWLTTENPAFVKKISINELKKSHPLDF